MVRTFAVQSARAAGSPHARGDGPKLAVAEKKLDAFSPRAWGWSATESGSWYDIFVLPTRVGMVRAGRRVRLKNERSPHARGDGPRASSVSATVAGFSPRAWGWSAEATWSARQIAVLPTRVGMVRGRADIYG